MRKNPFPRRHLILFAVCLVMLLVSPISGQRLETAANSASLVQDWTMRHEVYARTGSVNAMLAAQRDPRAVFSWRAAFRAGWNRSNDDREDDREEEGAKHQATSRWRTHSDWRINLGKSGTAPGMFPAKFTFDTTAVPNCATDFVTFPVNAAGSGTQPNIVAFNNLYSGTAGGNGACNRVPSASDIGTAATVLWSYNVQGIAAGGSVTTSPALSLTGTKIAFVESAAGSPAHFHVLAWKSGDGQVATNLQDVLQPKTINAFSSNAPAAGSGAATDLALGASTSGTDTLSSPFVDYSGDVAYVGNDQGILYRIKDVFCTANPACAGATPPAPSIDATWGSSGSVTVGPGSCSGTANSTLTGPVPDFITSNVFVGCADGKLYGFNSSGTALTIPSVIVGNGTLTGQIVDPPIIDALNGFVYVVSGNSASGSAVLVQTKTDLSSAKTVTLGAGGIFNLHSPQFNDAYFSSAASATWLIYAAGYDAAGNFDLFGATFDASRNLVTGAGTPANVLQLRTPPACEFSPTTEFLNQGTDWLFASILCAVPGNIGSAKIATFPAGLTTVSTAGNGTSGIVVDNASAVVQASSIYLGTQNVTAACTGNGTGGCAVKLTQAAFQ